VVDVEVLAEERIWARVAVPRGLSKLLSLTMPELGVRIAKESGATRLVDIGIYADIEQGRRPPLRGVCENSPRTSNVTPHSTLGCTLQVWKRLKE
jgi:hypothetical protein